jgi:hypothetical protein
MEKRNIKRELIRLLAETIGPFYHEEILDEQFITGELYDLSDGLIRNNDDMIMLFHELKLVYIDYMERECL